MSIGIKQTRFDGGETSPSWYARTDHPRYATALRKCKNWIPTPTGQLVSRPGTVFTAITQDQGTLPCRLEGFLFSDGQAFLFEFGTNYVKIYKAGSAVQTFSTPWAANMLPYLKLSQAENVIEIACGGQLGTAAAFWAGYPITGTGGLPPREIRYIPNALAGAGFGTWTFGTTALTPNIDPSNTNLYWFGGTLTQSITNYDPTYAGYVFGNVVLSNNLFYVAVQATTPAGQTPSGTSLWWNDLVDVTHQPVSTTFGVTITYLDTNTGVTGETEVLAATTVVAPLSTDRNVIVNFSGAIAQNAHTVVLYYSFYQGNNGIFGWEGDSPNPSYTFDGTAPDFSKQPPTVQYTSGPFQLNNLTDYPAVVAHFEQRRMFANTVTHPMRFYGSAIGNFARFDQPVPGRPASDAYNFDIASDGIEDVRSMVGLRVLVVLSGQGEWSARGADGGAIGQTNIDLKRQSRWGSSWLNPVVIGNGLLFNTAKSNMVRDFYPMYGLYTDNWEGEDLSAYARHFFEHNKIVSWAFQSTPYQVVWAVRDDGVLLSLTYDRKKEICGWAQHTTGNGDVFESVCVIPEPPMDAVYVTVRRKINGVWVRYVERFDNPIQPTDIRQSSALDCAFVYDGHNTNSANGVYMSGSAFTPGSVVTVYANSNIFKTDLRNPASIIFDPDGLVGGPIEAKIVAFVSSTQVTCELQNTVTPAQQALWVYGVAPGATPYYSNYGLTTTGVLATWLAGLPSDTGLVEWPLWNASQAYNIGDTVSYNGSSWTALQATTTARAAGLATVVPGPSSAYWVPATTSTRGLSALADGATIPSVAFDGAGLLTLDKPALVLRVGLSYDCDVELLDLNTQATELRNKYKRVIRVGFEVAATRGIWVGQSFTDLVNEDIETDVNQGTVPPLLTDYREVFIASDFNKNGRAVLRHFEPLPAQLLSVLREVELGGT